ncbi:hypothetical protein AB00_1771 [Raoultella ornithinolytica 2-156-04_S1_C1]|nr:hypothetical protein AB00_1771 [Raoultella ornithinolytica 2-156-04_S1_C1]
MLFFGRFWRDFQPKLTKRKLRLNMLLASESRFQPTQSHP